MKWLRWVGIAVLLLFGALVAVLWSSAVRADRPVGFQSLVATTTAGQRFSVGVWYPTTAKPRPATFLGLVLMEVAADAPVAGSGLPMVLISHGNGGGTGSHADLALALASAGYVVAAPMHSGDNYADQSGVGSSTYLGNRTGELTATIDHLLTRWPDRARIDPDRIGAFGFSAGGLTVLTAAGVEPELSQVATHCAQAPEFACDVLRKANSPWLEAGAAVDRTWSREPRIRAAAVAAPALGFTMRPEGFANVSVPLQVWSADGDTNVPNASNTDRVRAALGERAEHHAVQGAGHFSFLVPCGLIGPAVLCDDRDGFDRKAFHTKMNWQLVTFFDRNMPKR